MKRLITGLLVVTSSLLAQDPEFFGYLESQLMGAQIDGKWIQLQSNKFRLDLKANVADQLTVAANYNWTTYHGKTQWQIPDYLPETVRAQIPTELESYLVLPFEDTQVLDNAFIKWMLPRCDLTLGKQQLSFGAGYAWNPTDLLNNKDLLDPTYEQPGHNAVRLDLPLGQRINATVVYAPEDTWENSTKMVNIKLGLARFDVSVMSIERIWNTHDYTRLNDNLLSPDFLLLSEKRQMVGGSAVGELLGWGVWAEAGFNTLETRDDLTEWLIGTDHTFDNQTYVMVEYYENSQGKSDSKAYTLNDWMRYLAAEQRALSRNQCYALVQHPLGDLMQLGLSAIYSLSDGSVAFLPTFNWTPLENLEILAYLNLYQGEKTAVFNSNMGNGGLVRVRAYF